ncbi:phage tail protein [Chelatococcus asaccharovorans]|uniref:hypothetical protein n=1 Tax=Chelatococcus asaccharovorans TaxID=28210 RepID=UPI00224C720A|nr:hypothetical protein [Chelatococcus asaccharovorans]CAH1672132.1 conserved hypothetical protein [Chelatococcus asaccharovorans]CAH1676453.1 conserved hypothetical protein [Chelatococcus asaccharovorans]
MADSNITIASLSAAGGPGVVTLSWVTVGGGAGCLNYLALKSVEVWSSATNNRGSATKAGEGVSIFAHTGLTGTATRYYWVRAVDTSGNLGDFFPASATAGIAGTPTRALGPGQVTNDDLAGAIDAAVKLLDASITNAKIVNLSVEKLLAGTINAAVSMTSALISGGSITGGRINIAGTSYAFPVIFLNPNMGAGLNGLHLFQTGNTSESAALFDHNGNGPSNHGLRARNRNISLPSSQWPSGIVGAANGYAFFSEYGGYGPFTGQHSAMIDKGEADFPLGSIVCDREVLARLDVNDTLTRVALSEQAQDATAVGVVASRAPFDPHDLIGGLGPQPPGRFTESTPQERLANGMLRRQRLARLYDHLIINSVGEGQVLVCGRGGDLAAGDLICTSTLRGVGMRQPSQTLGGHPIDLVTNHTVARVREPVAFTDPDEVKLVSCIYLCG